jgi:F-type H+-transporting ATPase subunit delta
MVSKKAARREAKRILGQCMHDAVLDEARLRQIAREIAASGARERLAVLTELERLVRLYETEHTAAVESAAPLPDALRAELSAALKVRYGDHLAMTFSERPSLIGGVRIRVGSDVYDDTVLARLAALEKSF